MSESGEIIGRLLGLGANYETIGQAVGRNRSLVRQVGIGAKPGHNLRESLAELERRVTGLAPGANVNREARQVPVAAPERRKTGRGHLARVRKAVTISRTHYSISTVKKQAAASGARGLGHTIADAADQGRTVAVSVTFDRSITVHAYGKGKRGRAGAGGTLDFELGDAEAVAEGVVEHGGNVMAYIVAEAMAAGHITGADPAAHVLEVELRTY